VFLRWHTKRGGPLSRRRTGALMPQPGSQATYCTGFRPPIGTWIRSHCGRRLLLPTVIG